MPVPELTPEQQVAISAQIERWNMALPAALREKKCWLLWRYEAAARAEDRKLKVPYYANGSRRWGVQGTADDVAKIATYERAIEAFKSGRYSGIGIAHIPGIGINSWDFDNCVTNGAVHPDLREVLDASGSYAELSPSRNGVRLITIGRLPSAKNVNTDTGYNVECFGESGFVTITGNVICGEDIVELPPAIEATLRGWLELDTAKATQTRVQQMEHARMADPTYQRLRQDRLIKREWPDGRASITCPFEREHTSGSGDSDTVYFLPNTHGYQAGHFKCLHAHCSKRTDDEFREALGVTKVDTSALLAKFTAKPAVEGQPERPMLLDLAELRAEVGTVRWLVKHVLPEVSIGSVYGASGAFKSFVVLDASLHIAHGLQWLGRKTKRGGVVYVAAEGGTGLVARADAWHRKHEIDASKAQFRACIQPLMLDRALDLGRLSNACEEALPAFQDGLRLVVIDTLAQTMGGDENEAQATSAYLRNLGAALRDRFACTVVILHHTGHQNGDRPRGSSAIKGNLDFLFAVERPADAMACEVTCKKQKDGDTGYPLAFALERVELGRDEDGDLLTSLVAVHHDNAAEILKQGRPVAWTPSKREQLLLDLVGNGKLHGDLRTEFYEKLGDMKGDSKLKAFNRVFDTLVQQGLIVEKNNCVFPTEDA